MRLPYTAYRQTWVAHPRLPYTGLDQLSHMFLGKLYRYGPVYYRLIAMARGIHEQGEALQGLSDAELKSHIFSLKDQFRRSGAHSRRQPLKEGLAALVELSERTVGIRPHQEQIMATLGLLQGYLAEMRTGEGKSLVVALRAVLAGWLGKPCHCVTANDYLVQRDCGDYTPLFEGCGLTVGAIISGLSQEERRHNYEKDVVYVTAKELVFDFLRDRLKLGASQHPTRRLIRERQRGGGSSRSDLLLCGLDTAIVDEADSLLIDEAVTPVVISTQRENKVWKEAVHTASELVDQLVAGVDYTYDLKHREVSLTKHGRAELRRMADRLPPVWRSKGRQEELVHQALMVRRFYHCDRDYVIKDGKVVIVDEYTGRLMPGRTWGSGLHQAVEAMEGLEISSQSETLARLSYQHFFRLFRSLSGLTGTASAAAGEFWRIYRLMVLPIPTHRPVIRVRLADQIFADEEYKFDAIVEETMRISKETGRPILIGTRSIHASEKLAERFAALGVELNVLNANQDVEESRIIARAGQLGQITIATNMAGRGTDIKLGNGVAQLGGLHVMVTERHDAARIDEQLYGRCARQGDPGSVRAYASMGDELPKRFLPWLVRRKMKQLLILGFPGAQLLARGFLNLAQYRSERRSAQQRMRLLIMDDWLKKALSFGTRQGV
ncbi:MAG: prepilin peptidase [Magnetococcales bacterium]|nr:prepilin peptidase [Magnetococcales bacterium]